ncbi:MAG: DUF6270 domain-containing protein [Brachybacterium sp.]
MREPLNTLIYGSCVARDVLRVVPEAFELSRYIARQSWVSAFSPPVPVPDLSKLASSFQRRSIEGDFGSTAAPLIRRHSETTDVMLMDLASDRHGIVEVDGSYVSLTPEHRRAFGGIMPGGKVIHFGTDRHFSLFSLSAERAKATIEDAGLQEQSFILKFQFTERTVDGEPVPAGRRTPTEDNGLFLRYYDELARLGFNFSTLPDELAVSTSEHRWGAASDHFVDAAYQWWAKDVTARVTAKAPRP